jgi:tRNA(Leu) C34 or U34 (ribose-2'-O)-methylase TrmL
MPTIVFLPDEPVDRPGDLFADWVGRLGLDGVRFSVEGDVSSADFVAFVGRRRAKERLGRRVSSGRMRERLGNAEVWVLPSTAPERRGSFYEGIWRAFASRVLGRDLAVRDEFKGMAPDEIRAALEPRRLPFGVCCCNVAYDFNIGSVVRSANAFLAREVVLYGRRRWDRRGAMGAYHYENIVHVPDAPALAALAKDRGYRLVLFEEREGAVPLPDFRWPPMPLLVFGQEGPGIPAELFSLPHQNVFIPQQGSIRSLNLGVAAGIALYSVFHRLSQSRPS